MNPIHKYPYRMDRYLSQDLRADPFSFHIRGLEVLPSSTGGDVMLRFALLTCLIAVAATSQVFAQQMEDVVYFEDGGVVRGTIIEQIPGKSLKIQTRDGSVFVFTMDEIAKLAKEMPKEVPKEPVMEVGGADILSSASAGATGAKVEIGTLLTLTHVRREWGYHRTGTGVRLPSILSVWLIPSEYVAIGSEISSEIAFYPDDTNAESLLTGKVAFSPTYTSTTSIYVLGTGSLYYYDESEINAGIGMGLRARMGSAFVLRMEGRYERWFEREANHFLLIIGLGTELGG